MRKILIVLISLVVHLNANDLINITLNEFTNRVSKQTNKNIYLDQELNTTISLFVPSKISNSDIFSVYKNTISKNGLQVKSVGSVYYVSKKQDFIQHKYIYKLSYNCSEDFKKYLSSFNYKFVYFASNNSFIVSCNYLQNKQILKFLKSLDKQAEQVVLKFYILSYDDDLKNENGMNFSTIYKDVDNSLKIALNTLVFPISSSTNILSSTSFYSALKFLNSKHKLTINQYPFVLVKNNIPFNFKSVQNVPYLVKNTVTDSNNVQQNNSYSYKDVGLKIRGVTQIYDKFISLNLELTIEDILSLNSFTPTTNKRYLNSITNLKFDEVLILSGIKQTKRDITDIKIPFLCNIPYLGKIFQYEYVTNTKSNITIAIQVLRPSSKIANDVLSTNEELVSDKHH